jgi:Ca2+-binding RTX toxin-like protein
MLSAVLLTFVVGLGLSMGIGGSDTDETDDFNGDTPETSEDDASPESDGPEFVSTVNDTDADGSSDGVPPRTDAPGSSNPSGGETSGGTATPSGGSAEFQGSTGDDTLTGTSGADILIGGAGDDVLDGASGADTIFGDDGDDTIYGGTGDDDVIGGAGDDLIYLGGGDDMADTRVSSNDDQGDDTIFGGAGDDFITDVIGSNELFGGTGYDTIFSVDGFDGTGTIGTPAERGTSDMMEGGDGDDLMLGDGADTMTGGAGQDTFVINDTDEITGETATITDFDVNDDVFTVVDLFNEDEPLDIVFRANAQDTAVFAFVNGQPVAMLEGLSVRDIPNIDTVITG